MQAKNPGTARARLQALEKGSVRGFELTLVQRLCTSSDGSTLRNGFGDSCCNIAIAVTDPVLSAASGRLALYSGHMT